jgi:hypothetical protein
MTSYGLNRSSAFFDDSAVSYVSIVNERVQLEQPIFGRRQLRPPDIGRAVNHLPLQVAEIDDVEIDDADRADTRCGQVERRGRAEPPAPMHSTLPFLSFSCPSRPPPA